jgi:hypothetical protein
LDRARHFELGAVADRARDDEGGDARGDPQSARAVRNGYARSGWSVERRWRRSFILISADDRR